MNTRQKVLTLIHDRGDCHIGSCFSCVEMVECVYDVLGENDKFILSKAHASRVVDALGHIPQYVGALHCYGGSLGNGYGIGLGMALAQPESQIYVLIGDGEFDEGSTLEAFNYHRAHRIKNLWVLVDNNGWQGLKSSRLPIRYSDPFVQTIENMYRSVGYVINNALFKRNLSLALTDPSNNARVIVCNTVKGNGIKELEDTLVSHYYRMSDGDYERWMVELDGR